MLDAPPIPRSRSLLDTGNVFIDYGLTPAPMLESVSFPQEKERMARVDEIKLSTDEFSMVTKSQLGAPLEVYRLKRGLLRFYYGMALFLFVITLAVLLLVVGGSFKVWHEKLVGYEVPATNYFQFFFTQYLWLPANLVGCLTCLSCLVVGPILWWVNIPEVRYERVIVCEEGVLHLEWERRGYQMHAIRWTAIESIAKIGLLPEYLITYWQDTKVEKHSLHSLLENIDELVAQIRQRARKVSDE